MFQDIRDVPVGKKKSLMCLLGAMLHASVQHGTQQIMKAHQLSLDKP